MRGGNDTGRRIELEGTDDTKGASVGISDWNAVGTRLGSVGGNSVGLRVEL